MIEKEAKNDRDSALLSRFFVIVAVKRDEILEKRDDSFRAQKSKKQK